MEKNITQFFISTNLKIKNFFILLHGKLTNEKKFIKKLSEFSQLDKYTKSNSIKIELFSLYLSENDHLKILDSNISYQTISSCPICKSPKKVLIKTFDQHKKNGHEISFCENCNFVFQSRRLSNKFLIKHFANEWLHFDNNRDNMIAAKNEPFNTLKKYLQPKSNVLDCGCGLGDRLHAFKKSGHFIHGFDPSRNRTKKASSFLKTEIHATHAENYFKNTCNIKFDCIYFYCVLSFISNPLKILKLANNALNDNGIIYIRDGDFSHRNFFQLALLGMVVSYFSLKTIQYLSNLLDLEVLKADKKSGTYILRKNKLKSSQSLLDKFRWFFLQLEFKKYNFNKVFNNYIKRELFFGGIFSYNCSYIFNPFNRKVNYSLLIPKKLIFSKNSNINIPLEVHTKFKIKSLVK